MRDRQIDRIAVDPGDNRRGTGVSGFPWAGMGVIAQQCRFRDGIDPEYDSRGRDDDVTAPWQLLGARARGQRQQQYGRPTYTGRIATRLNLRDTIVVFPGRCRISAVGANLLRRANTDHYEKSLRKTTRVEKPCDPAGVPWSDSEPPEAVNRKNPDTEIEIVSPASRRAGREIAGLCVGRSVLGCKGGLNRQPSNRSRYTRRAARNQHEPHMTLLSATPAR